MDIALNSTSLMWLYVFGGYTFVGVLAVAWIASRKEHNEELVRLSKHAKKMEAKEAAKIHVDEDIFLKEKDDFLGRLLSQAGLESKYEKMKANWIAYSIGTPVLLAVICFIWTPELIALAFIFGLPMGAFGYIQYLKFLIKQRQNKLTAQLPGVLETMVSSLKSGSPVVECFKLLSETSPDPIRSEFKRSLISLQLGKPFREVLGEMSVRIRTPDFRLLTQAIFISQDVGANLADVVAVIAEAIRERFRLRDFMNALTAQGKATAVFIGCLPYFITGCTWMMAPGYLIPFFNHPVARLITIFLTIWEFIGFYILIKMTTFEV